MNTKLFKVCFCLSPKSSVNKSMTGGKFYILRGKSHRFENPFNIIAVNSIFAINIHVSYGSGSMTNVQVG